MPTDSYACKCLKTFIVSVTLLLSLNYNALAVNSNFVVSNDSTTIQPPDSTAANRIEWFKPDLRSDAVDFAKQFLGLPYRYAGRDPKGFDCSGFTHYIMKNFGVEISACSRTQGTQGTKVTLQTAKPGDLIFFRHSRRSRISHVAMVYSNDEKGLFVIHSTSRGVVIDDLMHSKYWRPKVYIVRDVASPFLQKYAVERVQQLLEQEAKLKSLQLDLALLSKGISI